MIDQEPPFSIQIEFSEGCNLYCSFCGLQGIRTQKEKNFMFMDRHMAWVIASNIKDAGWNSRIEFAMHGEPTMNPDWIKLIQTFREVLPNHQLMMTSNGGGLLSNPSGLLLQAFDAGLNVFGLDCYDSVNIHPKVRNDVLLNAEGFDVYEYPEDKTASPHKRWPKGTRALVYIKDIVTAPDGNHDTLNNHAGSAFPRNTDGHGKRCAKVFREMSIRWDGRVAICCNDWRGQYNCGELGLDDINSIWQSPEFRSARKFLIKGDRAAIGVCSGCDAVSYRVGLLPDKFGKVKLPEPTEDDYEIVQDAQSHGFMTIPVKRIYE